jgi:hypothetical protein
MDTFTIWINNLNINYIKYKTLMKTIWLIVILFFIVLTIIEIIKQNPEIWNNKLEGFINNTSDINNNFNYANIHKTTELNILNDLDKSEIVIKSPVPPEFNIGIETNNSIDIRIAQYFTNNIIPSKVLIDYNLILLNKVNKNKIDLAFVREYELIRYMYKNNNIRVIMPTFNKYIIALTSANNDIDYIEDINNYSINTLNICYINDDDIEIVKSIMLLQKLLPRISKKITYKKINSLIELKETDIFIGLIVPEDKEEDIRNGKLKPIFYHPTERIPKQQQRLQFNLKINTEDTDIIREFYYDLKNKFEWLSAAEIFPTADSQAYRTYKVRYILICNSNSKKLLNGNFRTFINNWWSHRMLLKNIYQVSARIKRGYPVISDTFTDLASISPLLKFYDEMKIFLSNKKLLSYS